MAGDVLGELVSAAVTDEVLEDIGNKVEKVTKHFPFFKYNAAGLFFIGWGIYFIWFY